jgi:phage-related protein
VPNVGRAEVEIVADLSQFGKNLQRDLQKAVDKVKLNSSNLGDGIGDGVKGGVDRAAKSIKGLAAAANDSLEESGDTARRVGRKIGDEFQDAYKRVRSVVSRLSNVLFTFRSRVLLFGGAITIALAAAIAATDELLGLLLPAPALLAMVAASMATLAVATRGTGEAFAAAFGDVEAFEEALANLAPAAQDFVREFRDLVPLFKEIGIDTQQAFWEQLDGTLTKVAANLMGPVHRGMVAVATQQGLIAREMLEFAASSTAARTVAIVFDATAESMSNLVEATKPFLEGLATLIRIFAPRMAEINENAAEAARNFRDWAAEMERTGEAMEKFEQAADFLGTLGSILGSAFRLVGAGIDASHEAGVDLFETVADLIDQAADLSESFEAQEGIQEFFVSVDRLVRALLPVLGAAAVEVGRLTTPLADLVEAIAPGVKAALRGIVDGLTALVDSGGREFMEALSDALIIVSPHLKVLGQALGRLLAAVAPLLDPLARLVGFILEFAAGIALLLIPFIEPLTTLLSAVLTPIFEILLQLAEAVLPPLAEAFQRVSDKVSPLIEQLGGAFMELLMATLPLAIQGLTLIIDGIVWLIDKWIQYNDFLVAGLKLVWEWIKDNIVPIIRDELWPIIRDDLIPALADLRDEFMDLWEEIKNLWEEILELVSVITEDLDPDLNLARLALIAVYGAVFLLRYWLTLLVGTVRLLTAIVTPWVKAFKNAAGAVKSVKDAIRTLRSTGVDLLGTLKSIIDRGLRVANILGNMRDAAKKLASSFADIPSLPNLGGGLFNFFADGGIVNRATAAIIGEAGPEVVLPLSDPARSRELAQQSGLLGVLMSGNSNMTTARSAGRASGGSSSAPTVVVEAGAVVIKFEGVPDEQRARRVGNAAGEGLLNTLAARNARLALRSS